MFGRELRLAGRRRARLAQPLALYALAALLLALGAGPEQTALAAPALLWVFALFAALLAAGELFRAELEDGSLELWRTCGLPLAWLLAAKLAAHALIVAAPLAAAGPLLGLWLGMPGDGALALLLSLALGIPALCWIGALGAALTLSLPAGGVLLALIVLPLYAPVLISGAMAVDAALDGRSMLGPLALLAGLAVLAASLAPLGCAAALRAGQE